MKIKLSFNLFVILGLLLVALPTRSAHAASIRYAKPTATGTGDCSSWANACTLQTALTGAASGDEIWVKAGLYKPTMLSTDRAATFQLKDGVAVYGGFYGTEANRNLRNPAANLTILSGDIDNNDSQTPIITDINTVTGSTTNSYHVVTGATGATLDGFTITAGQATGTASYDCGGGMYNNNSTTLTYVTFSGNLAVDFGGGLCNETGNPMLTNVSFSSNSAYNGGGIYDYNGQPTLTNVTFNSNLADSGGGMYIYLSSPMLTNVTFSSNWAMNDGAGMYISLGSPTLTNVTFNNNQADYGGGIYDDTGNPTLNNVTFTENVANSQGGGIYDDTGNPTLTNVTFYENSARVGGGIFKGPGNFTLTNATFSNNSVTGGKGGGIFNNGSNTIIRNSILWSTNYDPSLIYTDSGHTDVSNSIARNWCGGSTTCTNVLGTDPRLGIKGDYGGYTQTIPLLAGSPAIDTGNDATCPATDQRGVARPQGAHCDIGAYELDTTPPTVVSSLRASTDPTNAILVSFNVTFSEAVTGVDVGDFIVSTSGIIGTAVTGVSGSGTTYHVNVNTGSGSGTLRLDVVDDDSIIDAASNPLGGAGAGNGNYTSGQYFSIDRSPPYVTGCFPTVNPTHDTLDIFNVSFSEVVKGVYSLRTTGLSGAYITGESGSGLMRSVQVNTGTGDGTLILDMTGIVDLAGNSLAMGGCGVPLKIDKTPPSVVSSLRASTNPTNASSVNFTEAFSEAVTGVDAGDFTVSTSGITGASVTGVSGSGTTYTITVNSGVGNGTLRLDLIDNDTIVDTALNPLGGAGAGNGNHTGDQSYTIDKAMPTVVSIVRYLSPNPNNTANVYFTVTFSIAVTGVDETDFALHTTGVVGASVSSVSGSGTTYHVNANTGSGSGTLRLDVVDNDSIIDAASNPLGGAGAGNGNYSSGQSYTIDKSAPLVTASQPAGPTPSHLAAVDFTVTFSEAVTGVDTGDFSLSTTGITGTSIATVTGSGTTYTITVNTGSGDGTLRLDVSDNDTILDLAGNPLGGAGAGNGNYTDGLSYTIDRTPPGVLTSLRAGTNPTSALSVDFTVTFSEDVTGVDASDFTPNASGITGASVSGVSGTGAIYTVTVNTGIGSGTLQLDGSDDDSILDLAGNLLGGTGAGNGNHAGDQFYTVQKAEVRWFIGLGDGTRPDQVTVEQSVADDFNALHPDIHLTLEVVDSATASATLANEITAGNAPDIIGPMGWAASNNLHGQTLDLAPLIASTGFDTSVFNPHLVSMYQTEEGQVSLPFSVYPSALVYNPALFDTAGLNYPPSHYGDTYTMPDQTVVLWDWNTLAQVGKLLTLDNSGKNATQAGFEPEHILQYGFSFGYESHPNYWGSYWRAGQMLHGTPGAYTAVVPDAWKAAWQWLYAGIWGTQPFIPNGSASGSLDGGNAFASGKLAMLENPSWYLTCCVGDLTSAGGSFQMGAMPAYNAAVAGRQDADTFRIWKNSPHPDQAFTALSYLVTTAVGKLIIGDSVNPPAYPLMLPALTAKQPDWLGLQKTNFPDVSDASWNTLMAGLSYPDIPNAERYVPNFADAWSRSQDLGDLIVSDGSMSTALLNLEISCLQTDLTDIYNSQPAPGCRYISGHAGVGGATLSYDDHGARTATAGEDGTYFFMVSDNWTGIVTPSKAGYSFSPATIPYTNITTNQSGQDYTFSLNPYLLSVSKTGSGSGTMTSDTPGIDCGSDCSETYDYNTSVTLTAVAATGSTFTGWSGGGCSGTGTCTVIMDSAKSVTADFTLNTYLLSVSVTGAGSGTVTSSPGDIDCGATCSASFNYNTSVTLTATAAIGSTFTGWSGESCTGTGTCNVIMDSAKSVTANYTQNEYTLTITSAHGTVAKNPDKVTYHEGDVVQLTATPEAGWSFTNWTGALTGSTNPGSVTIHGNTSVTANYTQDTYRIYLPLVIR